MLSLLQLRVISESSELSIMINANRGSVSWLERHELRRAVPPLHVFAFFQCAVGALPYSKPTRDLIPRPFQGPEIVQGWPELNEDLKTDLVLDAIQVCFQFPYTRQDCEDPQTWRTIPGAEDFVNNGTNQET